MHAHCDDTLTPTALRLEDPHRARGKEIDLRKSKVGPLRHMREVHPAVDIKHEDLCVGEEEAHESRGDPSAAAHIKHAQPSTRRARITARLVKHAPDRSGGRVGFCGLLEASRGAFEEVSEGVLAAEQRLEPRLPQQLPNEGAVRFVPAEAAQHGVRRERATLAERRVE